MTEPCIGDVNVVVQTITRARSHLRDGKPVKAYEELSDALEHAHNLQEDIHSND